MTDLKTPDLTRTTIPAGWRVRTYLTEGRILTCLHRDTLMVIAHQDHESKTYAHARANGSNAVVLLTARQLTWLGDDGDDYRWVPVHDPDGRWLGETRLMPMGGATLTTTAGRVAAGAVCADMLVRGDLFCTGERADGVLLLCRATTDFAAGVSRHVLEPGWDATPPLFQEALTGRWESDRDRLVWRVYPNAVGLFLTWLGVTDIRGDR